MKVLIKKLHENAVIPHKTYQQDYCYDVTAVSEGRNCSECMEVWLRNCLADSARMGNKRNQPATAELEH